MKNNNDIKMEILNEIKKWETIIIHRHVRPDPDAIGSQVGLAKIIEASFPNKTVYTAGVDEKSLSFLAKMNPPLEEDYENALIIITDTANKPRIDGLTSLENLEKIIKIDHHPNVDSYGDIQWVNDQASSTSELITEFWLEFPEELILTDEAARLLYAGIVSDTNRFLYDATTPKTMRLAAKLMEKSFSSTDLNYEMNELSPEIAKFTGYVYKNLKISETGVASIILDVELLEKFSLTDGDTHSVVPLPGSIAGVYAWGIFVEQADGTYRCRLRSKGPVINKIASEHDGGGHPLASGANANDQKEIKEILIKLEQAVEQYKKSKLRM